MSSIDLDMWLRIKVVLCQLDLHFQGQRCMQSLSCRFASTYTAPCCRVALVIFTTTRHAVSPYNMYKALSYYSCADDNLRTLVFRSFVSTIHSTRACQGSSLLSFLQGAIPLHRRRRIVPIQYRILRSKKHSSVFRNRQKAKDVDDGSLLFGDNEFHAESAATAKKTGWAIGIAFHTRNDCRLGWHIGGDDGCRGS